MYTRTCLSLIPRGNNCAGGNIVTKRMVEEGNVCLCFRVTVKGCYIKEAKPQKVKLRKVKLSIVPDFGGIYKLCPTVVCVGYIYAWVIHVVLQ